MLRGIVGGKPLIPKGLRKSRNFRGHVLFEVASALDCAGHQTGLCQSALPPVSFHPDLDL
jgi:hypothetical protein